MTEISAFWFYKLRDILPNHVVSVDIDMMPEVYKYKDQLGGRTMLVQKAKVVPLEAIVRGYLTGTLLTYSSRWLLHGYPRIGVV